VAFHNVQTVRVPKTESCSAEKLKKLRLGPRF
jgi:hypothetical protein